MESKMMFRPNCSGFAEAMKQAKEIDATPEALLKVVTDIVGEQHASAGIECKYATFNPRNQWDTYYVVVRGYGVVGYCTQDVFSKE